MDFSGNDRLIVALFSWPEVQEWASEENPVELVKYWVIGEFLVRGRRMDDLIRFDATRLKLGLLDQPWVFN